MDMDFEPDLTTLDDVCSDLRRLQDSLEGVQNSLDEIATQTVAVRAISERLNELDTTLVTIRDEIVQIANGPPLPREETLRAINENLVSLLRDLISEIDWISIIFLLLASALATAICVLLSLILWRVW